MINAFIAWYSDDIHIFFKYITQEFKEEIALLWLVVDLGEEIKEKVKRVPDAERRNKNEKAYLSEIARSFSHVDCDIPCRLQFCEYRKLWRFVRVYSECTEPLGTLSRADHDSLWWPCQLLAIESNMVLISLVFYNNACESLLFSPW